MCADKEAARAGTPTDTWLIPDPEQNNDDADSALGQSIVSSYSATLASSVFNYRYENGRRYHAFHEGEYLLPNDDDEQDRLDMLHHIYKLTTGGTLYRAPLYEQNAPTRVLDLGCGTGLWSIELADEFPQAIVIGTDLSPIQPNLVPPNCKFYVDDIESPWAYPEEERFDYIHGRALCGSIRDWPKLFSQAYENLQPGGWLELQECSYQIFCDDETIEQATPLTDWVKKVQGASMQHGKNLQAAPFLKHWVEEAGFTDVHEETHKVAIGPWPKGKMNKDLGTFFRAQFLDAVEPYTLALFTRVLGYPVDELKIVIARVRDVLLNSDLHLYTSFHFIWGKKAEIPT